MPTQPRPERQGILLITRNFPPLLGGMERLNWHLAAELGKRHAVHVIAPAGAAAQAPTGVTVEEVPLKPLWRFVLATTWRALRTARRMRPAVVLAGSGLTAPIAWLAARCTGARAVAYVHGLDITVPHALYRRLWLPALRRLDAMIANSRATAELAAQAGISPQRIHIVHPGVQLPPDMPGPRPTPAALGVCRTLGVDSENAPRRDQFLPDSPPHSGAMGQEDGKKWAAAAHSQPT
ncbi:MAG: glycosyltransferase, partial [Burkholderiaceae bacterium]|nr:glycosyltransferase [Burkholderiaceae bacterium]